mmetsp:Transcript_15487/g.60557  ORF Transcript_15487/g.60557 Transcript_15487/m.60557 type:complete len:893 (-) Transcript_15487:1971-4649(-)
MSDKDSGSRPPRQPVENGSGVVKCVDSGDSLVVYETAKARNGPPPERVISLSMLQAPRLARRGGGNDEKWAWASREFLRNKCVGKNVTFTIEHKTEPKEGRRAREFGIVYIGNTNLVKVIAAEGWAEVRKPPEGKEARSPLQKECLELSAAAEANKLGIFQEDTTNAVRKIPRNLSTIKVFDELKNKPQPAIVEYVREGTNMRVTLTNTFHSFILKVSGAEAPAIPPAHKNQSPQPFALESKFFVERYVLQRNVTVTVRTPGNGDNADEFYGTLNMEGQELGEELIRQGLAKFVEWNAPPARADIMRQLENQAREGHIRIWKYATTSAASTETPKEFEGKVREVRDGSCIVVNNTSVSPPQRVTVVLSSIVAPRMGRYGSEDEPWAFEAKDLLRSKLLGKKVRVVVDYIKPATTTTGKDGKEITLPAREFCSVYLGSTSVALFLVEEGLARTSSARDSAQSAAYEQLLIAEKRAKAKNKAMWNKDVEAPKHRISDLTQRGDQQAKNAAVAKARAFLPSFQRAGRVKGSVEYVMNGSRVKVLIPKENALVVFALESIRTPSGRGGNKEPLAEECTEYVREKLHQRNVELLVDDVDKGGNFIGSLWVKNRNFGLNLLEVGFASVNERSAEYSQYGPDYMKAQETAKAAKVGIWQFEVNHATRKVEAPAEAGQEPAKPKLASVSVIEVVDGGWFYVQHTDDAEKLDALMASLNDNSLVLAGAQSFNKNQLCVAKFADGKWYRAKVVSRELGKYEVNYVDYGNVATVSIDELRTLPAELSSVPAFAKECVLAYIDVPAFAAEYGDEAAEYFHSLVWGKQLLAGVEGRDGDKLQVTLGDPQTEQMVNVEMVGAGFATVQKRPGRNNPVLVKRLQQAQESARDNHAGMWEYGDFQDEE